MTLKTERVIEVFIAICFSFGILIGCVGLGAGLIFLSVPQAVGVCILSIGCGSLFGMVFGTKWIMKALIETLKEEQARAVVGKFKVPPAEINCD